MVCIGHVVGSEDLMSMHSSMGAKSSSRGSTDAEPKAETPRKLQSSVLTGCAKAGKTSRKEKPDARFDLKVQKIKPTPLGICQKSPKPKP